MSTTKASPMGAATLTTELWLGGRTARAHSGSTFPVHNPATGAVIAEVADASARDAVHALELAADAQRRWADTAPRVRGELLRAAFELLVSRKAEFAELITLEMGKPLPRVWRKSTTVPSFSAGSARRPSGSTAETRSRPTATDTWSRPRFRSGRSWP